MNEYEYLLFMFIINVVVHLKFAFSKSCYYI